MKGKYFTIQIIPEDSHGIRKFRVSTKQVFIFKITLIVLAIVLGIFIFHIGKINYTLANYEKMRVSSAQLVKKNENYEELFSRLNSLWVMENRIQNIFETFLENDSGKVNGIIERNRFAHTPSEKINVDFEGIHGWLTQNEKIRMERIPNVIPAVGIVSKKFSPDEGHLGIDLSAHKGNPVFASGSGTVEFAGQKDGLGNTVTINHQNGYISSYSHLKDVKTKKGKNVSKGDIIGTIGSTGNTSGPHLHYSVTKDGEPQDPEKFFNF